MGWLTPWRVSIACSLYHTNHSLGGLGLLLGEFSKPPLSTLRILSSWIMTRSHSLTAPLEYYRMSCCWESWLISCLVTIGNTISLSRAKPEVWKRCHVSACFRFCFDSFCLVSFVVIFLCSFCPCNFLTWVVFVGDVFISTAFLWVICPWKVLTWQLLFRYFLFMKFLSMQLPCYDLRDWLGLKNQLFYLWVALPATH